MTIDLSKIPFCAAHTSNYYKGRNGNAILYIVVHYTANDGDTDAGNANYFAQPNRGASAHYFVDEDSITQTVHDEDAAWHCGGGLQGNSGHTFYQKCTNRNSIGVEMCSDKVNGKYVITTQTVERTAGLVRALMLKYSVPVERVIRHYDVTGKICPEPWVRDSQLWEDFKNRLTEKEEPELTDAQVRAIVRDEMEKINKETATKSPSAWAQAAWERATEQGVTDGTSPQSPMTREMGVTMLQRCGLIGK